jgi:hypothetical protein
MRVVLAGIVGGIAMYVWTAIAHVATPLGMIGVQTLPNEGETILSLNNLVGENGGLYLFPAPPKQGAPVENASGSAGLLVWRPHALLNLNPKNLGTEFVSELAESVIAAMLLSWAAVPGFGSRVGFVTLLGLGATITTNVSNWNWYGFPTDYTLANGLILMVGYLAAGIGIALVLPRRTA